MTHGMTIQRWAVGLPDISAWMADDGLWVKYSDHLAAVEAARQEAVAEHITLADKVWVDMLAKTREQAIRDAIAAVEGTSIYIESGLATKSAAIAALRALLDGAE